MSEVCIEKIAADGDVCIPILILPHHFVQAPPLIRHNLTNWSLEVLQSEVHYTVTEVTYTKSRSPLQHEYLRLVVQGPVGDPFEIRIERNIRGNGLPGWIGLWGTAVDTVTILGPPQPSSDNRLHHLRWEGAVAPQLRNILWLVLFVERTLPHYCLAKTSCYSFARAIFLSINRVYHHNAEYSRDPLRWYSKECCLLGVVSAGSRRAGRAAERAAEEFGFSLAFPPT